MGVRQWISFYEFIPVLVILLFIAYLFYNLYAMFYIQRRRWTVARYFYVGTLWLLALLFAIMLKPIYTAYLH